MREAYGRCSELLHSQPGVLNPPLPEPQAISQEIDTLATWIESIRQRQKAMSAV
jgi:hypothetical protein